MQCNGGDDRLSSIEHVPATRFASVQRKWLKPRDACDRKNNLIVHSNWLTGQELSNPSTFDSISVQFAYHFNCLYSNYDSFFLCWNLDVQWDELFFAYLDYSLFKKLIIKPRIFSHRQLFFSSFPLQDRARSHCARGLTGFEEKKAELQEGT